MKIKFINWVIICTLFVLFPALMFAQDAGTDALTMLKDGNRRFYTGEMQHKHQDAETVKQLTSGQQPFAVIVSCSDSRVSPDIIFDQGLGDLFSIRTAGNVMGDYEEGSIEYAAEHLGTKLIVVLGHTSCGAVKAFIEEEHGEGGHPEKNKNSESLGHIQSIIDKLKNEMEEKEVFEHKDGDHYFDAIKANVIHGVRQLRASKPILAHLNGEGKIQIIGAIYHLDTGEVEFLDI